MPATVILTGSTGNLGCYLLAALAASIENVERIVCLNRSDDAEQRQQQQLKDRDLTLDPSSSERNRSYSVSYYKCDLSQSHLGLPKGIHQNLLATTTHIIHCAWPVDWNKPFSSFDGSIRGVANLIDFARAGQARPKLMFISSLAVAGNWGAVPGALAKVPEREIDDWKVARFGYGQSKLVAERLLAEANQVHNLTISICRVGQVAGPVRSGVNGTKSKWPEQEWLPSLVASSKHLGLLPKDLASVNDIDWVPVDVLADVILELALSNDQIEESIQYNHIVNPILIKWSELVPSVHQALGSNVELVDLPSWVNALEDSAQSISDADTFQNPAIKLLSFFGELGDKAIHLPEARAPVLDARETSKRSHTLRSMGPVSATWMVLWMKQLGYPN